MSFVTIDGYPFKKYWYKGKRLRKYRELRLYLIDRFKNCYFCGVECKDYILEEGEPQPDDMGTIEHLRSRQYRKRHEVSPKVLACHKCNHDRNVEELMVIRVKRGRVS